MTRFQNKEDNHSHHDRLMERIFNFPKVYRFKIWVVNHAFKFIESRIMKNHFSFDDVLRDRLPDGSSVFEIGCGDGQLYQRLNARHKNLKYIGSDINNSMIEHCRDNFPDVSWHCHDSLPYPYPDKYFDFCIIENVLHHLNNYDAVCDLLKEATRVSKSVLFFEPLQSDNKFLYFWKSVYWRITDGGKFYFTYTEFHNLFKHTETELQWEKYTEPLHQLYSCEIRPLKLTSDQEN